MSNSNDKIEKACIEAKQKFDEIGLDKFADIRSKLDFVLGSYSFDRNPVGLYEVGAQALHLLKQHKESNPKQVTKKLIDDLQKAIDSKS